MTSPQARLAGSNSKSPDNDGSVSYEPDWHPATPSTFFVGEDPPNDDDDDRKDSGRVADLREDSVFQPAALVPEEIDSLGGGRPGPEPPPRANKIPGQPTESSRRLKIPPSLSGRAADSPRESPAQQQRIGELSRQSSRGSSMHASGAGAEADASGAARPPAGPIPPQPAERLVLTPLAPQPPPVPHPQHPSHAPERLVLTPLQPVPPAPPPPERLTLTPPQPPQGPHPPPQLFLPSNPTARGDGVSPRTSHGGQFSGRRLSSRFSGPDPVLGVLGPAPTTTASAAGSSPGGPTEPQGRQEGQLRVSLESGRTPQDGRSPKEQHSPGGGSDGGGPRHPPYQQPSPPPPPQQQPGVERPSAFHGPLDDTIFEDEMEQLGQQLGTEGRQEEEEGQEDSKTASGTREESGRGRSSPDADRSPSPDPEPDPDSEPGQILTVDPDLDLEADLDLDSSPQGISGSQVGEDDDRSPSPEVESRIGTAAREPSPVQAAAEEEEDELSGPPPPAQRLTPPPSAPPPPPAQQQPQPRPLLSPVETPTQSHARAPHPEQPADTSLAASSEWGGGSLEPIRSSDLDVDPPPPQPQPPAPVPQPHPQPHPQQPHYHQPLLPPISHPPPPQPSLPAVAPAVPPPPGRGYRPEPPASAAPQPPAPGAVPSSVHYADMFRSYDEDNDDRIDYETMVAAFDDLGLLQGMSAKQLGTLLGLPTDPASRRGRLYAPHEFIAFCNRLALNQAKAAREERIRNASKLPELPPGAERSKLLRRVYARYSLAPGQGRLATESDYAEPRMTGSQLQRLITDLELMQPAGPLTAAAVGVVFAKCKPPGTRKLNLVNFLRALAALEEESGADVWAAATQLGARIRGKQSRSSSSGAPRSRPVSMSGEDFGPGPAPGLAGGAHLHQQGGDSRYYSDPEAAAAAGGVRLPRLPLPSLGPPAGERASVSAAAPPLNAPARPRSKQMYDMRKYSEPLLPLGRAPVRVAASFPGPPPRARPELDYAEQGPGGHGMAGGGAGGGSVGGGGGNGSYHGYPPASSLPPPRLAFATPPQAGAPPPPLLPPPPHGAANTGVVPGAGDVGLLSDPLLSGGASGGGGAVPGSHVKRAQVLRSLTGIATLPQGYALLASRASFPEQPQSEQQLPPPLQQQQQQQQQQLDGRGLSPSVAARGARSSLPGGMVLPGDLQSLQTLTQRVAKLEEQSQDHRARHAELRIELLQRMADLAAVTASSPAAAAAAAGASAANATAPPQSASTQAAADAAHVAVSAAGTAQRAADAAEEAQRTADEAADAAARAAETLGMLAERVEVCEEAMEVAAADAARRQKLEREIRAQRLEVEECRADVRHLEGSLESLVAAAVAATLEQQLEARLYELVPQLLAKAGRAAAPAPAPASQPDAGRLSYEEDSAWWREESNGGRQGGSASSVGGGGGGVGVDKDLQQRVAALEAALRAAEEGAAAAKAAAEAAEMRVAEMQAAAATAAGAGAGTEAGPVAATLLPPRSAPAAALPPSAVQRPPTADREALLDWLDCRVVELAAAAQAHALQVQAVQDQLQAASTSGVAAATAAAVAATEQRVSAAIAAAAAAEKTASRAASDATAARESAERAAAAAAMSRAERPEAQAEGESYADTSASPAPGAALAALPPASASAAALQDLQTRVAACEETAAGDARSLGMHQSVLDEHFRTLDEHAAELRHLAAAVEALRKEQQQQAAAATAAAGAGAAGARAGSPIKSRPSPPQDDSVGYDDIEALLARDVTPQPTQPEAASPGGGAVGGRSAAPDPAAEAAANAALAKLEEHLAGANAQFQELRGRVGELENKVSHLEGDARRSPPGAAAEAAAGEAPSSSSADLQAMSAKVDETAEQVEEALNQCRALKSCVTLLASSRSPSKAVLVSDSGASGGGGSERGSGGGGGGGLAQRSSTGGAALSAGDEEGGEVSPEVRQLVTASERRLRQDLDTALKELVQQSKELEALQTQVQSLERRQLTEPAAGAGAAAAAAGAAGAGAAAAYASKTELEELQSFTQTALEELSLSLRKLDGLTADLNADMQFAARDVGRLLVQVKQLQKLYRELAEAAGLAEPSSQSETSSQAH